MKRKNLLLILPTVMLLSSCGHSHDFTLEVASEEFLAEPATCTSKATYYYSCECGEHGEETFEYGDFLSHTLSPHQGSDATCEEAGSYTYYTCDVCGKCFSDAEGKTEIQEGDWVIEALGHTYSNYSLYSESYPEIKVSSKCDRCDEVDYQTIDGYDLSNPYYHFGVCASKLDASYEKTDDEIEIETFNGDYTGLDVLVQDFKNKEWFLLGLPMMNYGAYEQVKLRVHAWNQYGNHYSGSAMQSFTFLSPTRDWLFTLNEPNNYVEITFKTTDTGTTAKLEIPGSTTAAQLIDLSEGQAAGTEQLEIYARVWDGYRNLTIESPTVRIGVKYANDALYGSKLVYGEETVLEPTYCTNNYQNGEDKIRFDLSDKLYGEENVGTLYLPIIQYSTYESGYIPFYMECGAQNNGAMKFSFDGNEYFASDIKTADPVTSYLTFEKADGGYNFTYTCGGQILGSKLVADEDILNGSENLTMSVIAKSNWRRFSLGLPMEGEINLSYDFSYSAYGAKVYTDSITVEPQLNAQSQVPVGMNKLRFDLSDKGLQDEEFFYIALPAIKINQYEKVYLPVCLESGCQSEGGTNLQFSFDNSNYFNTDNATGEIAYIGFSKNNGSYSVNYYLGGVSVASSTISDQEVLNGTKNYVMYGTAGVNWRKFSILEPVNDMPRTTAYQATSTTDEWYENSGYAVFGLETNALATGVYVVTQGASVTVTRAGVTYECAVVGRNPVNKSSSGMWFLEKLSNWHMDAGNHSELGDYQDGDIIVVDGEFVHSSGDTVILKFKLEYHKGASIVTNL